MKKLFFILFALSIVGGCDYNGVDYDKLYTQRALINYYHETHPYYCDGHIIMKWAETHYTPVQDCSDHGQTCVLHDAESIGCEDF